MEALQPSDPVRIGSYTLTARLGAGGMGQVYLAETPAERQLAVKVIRSALVQDGDFRARFVREVDAARRVGGFHTALVVDADLEGDPAWVATAYIAGPTLYQAVRDDGPIAPPALHQMIRGLAEGIKAVHDCGLVHRDMKPGNVILSADGPRIIDFGIVRPLDAESLTTGQAVFGTLPYMSPEQTNGSRVGPASDVFSLGTVLAYAATGVNPFNGATMAETVHRLIGPSPDPGDIDPDTRELVADCWKYDPDQRPAPEAILARFTPTDPHGHRRGRPNPLRRPTEAEPAGHPPTRVETSERMTGRLGKPELAADQSGRSWRRTVWLLAAAVMAIVTVVTVGLVVLRSGGEDPQADAAPEPTEPTEPALLRPDITLFGHEAAVTAVAFGPDGTMVVTGSDDDTAKLWGVDVDTDEAITTFTGHESTVTSVALSEDGDTLATGSDDDTARLWDVDTGAEITTLTAHDDVVHGVAFSPDGTRLATVSDDHRARLWDVDTHQEITTIRHGSNARSVAFSPDSSRVVTGGLDGMARAWDVDTGEQVADFRNRGDVASVAFSPDGAMLTTGSGDDTAKLWDADTGEMIGMVRHGPAVRSVAFSPDGTRLVTGGMDTMARAWDVDTGEEVATFTGHMAAVNSVAFNPDGTRLATASDDDDVNLWALDSG